MKIFADKEKELDFIASVWTFACVTKNAKVEYKNIDHRYKKQFGDSKKVIDSHRILFLEGRVDPGELIKIKWLLLLSRPAWLIEWAKESKQTEYAAISNLQSEDFFSTQDRFLDTTPPSPVEVLKWGLEHIERLRNKKKEDDEKFGKLVREILIPLGTMLAAFATIIIGSYFQQQSLDRQLDRQKELQTEQIQSQEKMQAATIQADKKLKAFELEFSSKQSSFSKFIRYLDQAFIYAEKKKPGAFRYSLNQAEKIYYNNFEFFLNDDNKKLWGMFISQTLNCESLKEL